MKVLLFASFIAVCACARLESNYLPPPGADQSGGSGLSTPYAGQGHVQGHGHGQGQGYQPQAQGQGQGYQPQGQAYKPQGQGYQPQAQGQGQGYQPQAQRPQRPLRDEEPQIAVITEEKQQDDAGNYKFNFELDNGHKQEEKGEVEKIGEDEAILRVTGSYVYIGPDGVEYKVDYVADEDGFRPIGKHLPTPPPIPKEIQRSLQVNAAAQNAGNTGYSGGPSQGYQGSNSGRPSNQYVPPVQQRPSGNGGYNQQSGYKY